MAGHQVIVIGASAGGIQAIETILKALRPGLPAAVFIVVHVSADSPSMLPTIFAKKGGLPVEFAQDNAAIRHGRVYVAPPDRHLLLERGRMRVMRGPKENRHRPAIDPLFRSAAWAYGPGVVGVVLSGYLDDGVAGLWAVKSCGGVSVVQDPGDAEVPEMPLNAMTALDVDHCASAEKMGELLAALAREPPQSEPAAPPESIKREIEYALMHKENGDMSGIGTLSAYTCPSCRGPLWELREGEMVRYRCYTGHAYSSESLLAEQSEAIEDALYSAVRALEEKASLSRRTAGEFERRFPKLTAKHLAQVKEIEAQVAELQKLIAGARRSESGKRKVHKTRSSESAGN